ncbi:MAG: zinc-ribbon domain-containing protein [Thaumarchaeota archaeon]|nr:zinc-ribbon domain-containing protein [Nitrososphaerota archaeon]MCH8085811.1 zinc-ribbon domain-containing protein [Nitrososphaerota archaeon]
MYQHSTYSIEIRSYALVCNNPNHCCGKCGIKLDPNNSFCPKCGSLFP